MSDSEFGKYRLIAELGHGGMADVFLAVVRGPAGLGFSKLLVVKRLRPHLVEDPEFVAMLIDEARIAARLNHPNVVQTVEVGEVSEQYYIAMEFLDGQPLRRILHQAAKTRLPISKPLRYRVVADVLAGLHHAHELRDYDGTPLEIVHRDVTPHNVFVTYDGQVKLVDFGVAKAIGRAAETRIGGAVKGKIPYMAPEQALAKPVDRRADIFSCGVLLWEAAVGMPMWKDLQDFEIMGRLLNQRIPSSPRAVNPEVPDALDAICQKALAFAPGDRFATAREFQNAIEAYLETLVGAHAARSAVSATQSTNRDLGKLVADLFENRRKELRDVIERQLSSLKSEPTFTVASLSSLDRSRPPDASASPMARSAGANGSAAPDGADASSDASSEATLPTLVQSGNDEPASRNGHRARLTVVVVVAGLAVGAGLAAATALRGSSLQTTAAATAGLPEPVTSEEPPQPAAPELLTLTLRASPAEAEFILDDGPPLENPFIGRVPRDGQQHTLRIRAEGYVAKVQSVVFDQDAVVEVSLQREKPAARVGAAAAQPPKPPVKKRRKLDSENPFK